MKSIILSVSPQEAVNILNGKQTALLRRRVPKGFVGWCYLYVSKAKPYLSRYNKNEYYLFNDWDDCDKILNGKVLSKFWWDKVNEFKVTEDGIETDGLSSLSFIDLPKGTQLSLEQLHKYIKVGDIGSAIHIKNLEIFDEPKSLGEFKKYASEKDLKYCFEDSDCEGCKFSKKELECKLLNINSVKNYIYVEEME